MSDPPGGCLGYCFHRPVEEPRCLGAGQGAPETGRLCCHGSILKHPPGKVPLLRSPEGDGAAVHCALQVRMDPAPHNVNNTRQGQGSILLRLNKALMIILTLKTHSL